MGSYDVRLFVELYDHYVCCDDLSEHIDFILEQRNRAVPIIAIT